MDRDQLQRFLQDALSAHAGWTVVPPDPRYAAPAGAEANWTLEGGGMDAGMRRVVDWSRARYDMDPASCPAHDHSLPRAPAADDGDASRSGALADAPSAEGR